MFDEIAIPRLQPADIFHPLLDLFERDAQVRRHLIEGVGQLFDFIAGLEIQLLINRPLPIRCTPSCNSPIGRAMRRATVRPVSNRTPNTPSPYTVTCTTSRESGA